MKKDFIIKQEQRQPLRHLYAWLKSLQSTVIFMQTGAHPDDETSRILARLSLGDGMHVVYVNAVRGQGGQNALGPERGEALGYLRSEELFEAMKVIRADIGWLAETADDPICDFGFSKSAEQTYQHWGETHTLRQMVKMVRLFRPDILIPTFLDVPGQHGHHRAVTQTTLAAFDDAARADRFADLGLPIWQVNALYLPAWGGGGGSYDDEVPPPNATHEILTGAFDPVLGGTYAQVGEWSRACHATQGMGRPVDEEERPVPLHQLRTASGAPVHGNLTEGVPENLEALAAHCDGDTVGSAVAGQQAAGEAQQAAADALIAFPDIKAVMAALCRLQAALVTLEKHIVPAHRHRVQLKMRQAAMAASEASALQLHFEISPPVPEISSAAEAKLSWHVADSANAPKLSATLRGPDQLTCDAFAETTETGRRRSMTAKLTVSGPPIDAMTGWHGIMADPASLHAEVCLHVGGSRFVLQLCPDMVFSTKPRQTGHITPARTLLRLGKDTGVDIQLLADAELPASVDARLTLPDGWQFQATPTASGTAVSGRVNFAAGTGPGHYRIYAKLDDEPVYTTQELAYAHIRRQTRFAQAAADIALVDTAGLDGLTIGWIDGGVDQAHHWASQLGAKLVQLDDSDLQYDQFEQLDVLVAGVFAGGTRPLNQSMRYIRPWIEAGGHFVSQYHRPIDNWDQATSSPLPLQPGSPSIRWRVTDASAPVQMLKPDHPLLAGPNKITNKDFDGWVKERGLYFASEWDQAYVPLLAMADSGETPLEGSLLAAEIGAGSHVHCALNLFYQMDHMVVGAFRLFANLLTPFNGK
ncbi:MAG: PIG-L family deacetylase [Rhodospirillaceae bacterium]|nr:PIG-L family deacetylase [Rhodospirillaceae bacterium]